MIKIGIRPTIDGRERGIRESLEEQTMWMANAAAQLIESNLRDREGNKVECVIADSSIGGFAQAAACAEKFFRAGVCATLTVTPCWCYGGETMDMDKTTPEGNMGVQRHGASWSGLPCGGAGRAYAKRNPRVFYLWA